MAKMSLDDLVGQLRSAYGERLHAVVLYGSAAAGEHIAKRSDYNVLVVVESLEPDALRAASAVATAWADAGNPPPLTFTLEEWRASADIFPMEYADILERHRVLHGDPPFDGLTVDPVHLRLELEEQAMGKLLRLRQGYMLANGDRKLYLQLLEDSLSTIMVIFRAMVRLHGRRPSADYGALTSEIAALTGVDARPFLEVVRHVRGESRIERDDAASVLERYIAGVKGVVSHLDRFSADSTA